MLKLRFSNNGHLESFRVFTTDEVLFAIAQKPRDGMVLTLTDPSFCREVLCENIRLWIRKQEGEGLGDISRRFYMVLARKSESKKKLNSLSKDTMAGIHLARTIEHHYAWPLTKIYQLELIESQQNFKNHCSFHLISASSRWIKSPHMLSLYTLLLRLPYDKITNSILKKVTNLDTLFSTLSAKAEESTDANPAYLAYFRVYQQGIKVVLNNYDRLFSRRKMEDLYWFKGANTGNCFTEGINKLCDHETSDYVLREEFRKAVLRGDK